jgi:hypothetical protein
MKISTPWGVKEITNPCPTHDDDDELIVARTNPPEEADIRWIYQCRECGCEWIEGEGVKIVNDTEKVTYE